jgi:hypothetical protein
LPLWTAVADRPYILLQLLISTCKNMVIALWRVIVSMELLTPRIAPSAR